MNPKKVTKPRANICKDAVEVPVQDLLTILGDHGDLSGSQ